MPGTWWYLSVGGPTWLAMRADDNRWWWGRGPELTNEITDTSVDLAPVLSPNGSFLAVVRRYGLVSLIDTRDGREVGSLPVDFGEPEFRIRAVTNDGKVIVHGTETATLWLPLVDDTTVDLTETAPGQVFLDSTPAGLVVSDGFDGEQYLAEISDAGELEPLGDLPPNDSLVVSPVAEYMVWTPPGPWAARSPRSDRSRAATSTVASERLSRCPTGGPSKSRTGPGRPTTGWSPRWSRVRPSGWPGAAS